MPTLTPTKRYLCKITVDLLYLSLSLQVGAQAINFSPPGTVLGIHFQILTRLSSTLEA